MRRLMLLLTVAALACANIGCLAVVATETVATASKRVEVVDGQLYVIDLATNTAKPVRLVKQSEVITEVTSETTAEATLDETNP